jgi:hypothetical protein
MIYVLTYKVISNTGDEITSGTMKVKNAQSYQHAVERLTDRMKHNYIDFGRLKIIDYTTEKNNEDHVFDFLKSIFKLTIFIIFLSSCASDKRFGNAGQSAEFKTSAIHCLRDFLTGEDAGGTWQQIGTTPQDLSALLVGDNPCFEWNDKACGQYEFRYIVGDDCCRDTSVVRPLKCCMTGFSTCN